MDTAGYAEHIAYYSIDSFFYRSRIKNRYFTGTSDVFGLKDIEISMSELLT